MNCCNPMTGQCDQGPGCAAYMTAAAETPHDKAARHFWDASPPGYYEILDAPLNFWERRSIVGKACSIAGLIAVCAFVGVVVLV